MPTPILLVGEASGAQSAVGGDDDGVEHDGGGGEKGVSTCGMAVKGLWAGEWVYGDDIDAIDDGGEDVALEPPFDRSASLADGCGI